jgi:hypothetical protein
MVDEGITTSNRLEPIAPAAAVSGEFSVWGHYYATDKPSFGHTGFG